ncbi:solute carrier family 35 member E2B [Trichonephila clavata]|uniref:Solute carrier family 35 member E2B n=1 Tax=Trichonephila clavata TaxID=2740835 RepID=A0A8X6FYX1_TRICU|nr:solute carrier family 35 member E2B [Trichonephila clavata]
MDSAEVKPVLHREYYDPDHIGLSECIMEEKEPIAISRFDDEIPLLPDKNILKMKISSGLLSSKAVLCIILWYFFSFTTLFLNKYILAYEQGDPTLLGSAQLLMCCVCGYLHLKYPCGLYKSVNWERSPPHFYRNMFMVGSLRFSTLLLGLVALWFVPVSFAETVKSSAPVFTVFLAWLWMGEKTSWLVCLSLLPIMGGLALCSANELSFNATGFAAAMITNLSECLQNVFSKKLISGEIYSYSPPELQFYTSLASICVQVPTLILMVDLSLVPMNFTYQMILLFVINGVSFHFQSLTEYSLLSYISPVTHSVANTVKRAVLIWLSVITFGNKITFLGGLGTTIVIAGVFGYNKAKQIAPTVLVPSKNLKNVHSI